MGFWKVIRPGGQLVKRLGICAAGALTVLNFGPAATMAVTMLVSLAVYAAAFGWNFAAGFVMLLLIHELGHFAAARVVGLRSSIPVFVPFVGAVISLRQAPRNAKMEANVAIGGPAAGTLGVLFCLVFYLWTDSMLMLVLAYTGCVINLLNLIPCAPLDGGKIAAAISPHLWWIGSAATGVLFFYTNNLVILIVFLFSLFRLWQGDESWQGEGYYHLGIGQRIRVSLWYFGLLLILALTTLYLISMLP
jgi:Zn-dependent protease